jgi:hypothetical protein
MAVLKPRTRLVYFRVSEEEFQQFNRICESEGVRCLSDLVRSAMERVVNGPALNGNESVAIHLRSVDDRIAQLAAELRRLSDFILRAAVPNQDSPDLNSSDKRLAASEKERVDAKCA